MSASVSGSHHAWDSPTQLEEGEAALCLVSTDSESHPPVRTSPKWLRAALIAACALIAVVAFFCREAARDVHVTIRHPPSYITPAELALDRRKLLSSSMRPPSMKARKLQQQHQTLPGVALVFITVRGVRLHTIWQRWFEDAFAWLESEGLESNHDVGDETKHRSNIIRAYVHHPYWLDPSLKAGSVPPVMRAGIIEESADCTWWLINQCLHRALQSAVDDFQAAEWFYTVSSDTVPVKSFREMYESLLEDGRSRVEMSKFVFDDNMPKTSNWVMLPREYVASMARLPEMWAKKSFREAEDTHWKAGGDEWAIYYPLLDQFGEDFFTRQHPGVILLDPDARPAAETVNTFACWLYCEEWGEVQGHAPYRFTSMRHSDYRRLLTHPTMTHARKFDINTTITGCPQRRGYVPQRVLDFSLEHLRGVSRWPVKPEVRLTGGRNRTGLISDTRWWSGANFGPYHGRANCTITDFLSWRLNLNSTTTVPEESYPLTVLPGSYQNFRTIEQQHKALIWSKTYGVRPEIINKYNIKLTDTTTSSTTTTPTTATTTTTSTAVETTTLATPSRSKPDERMAGSTVLQSEGTQVGTAAPVTRTNIRESVAAATGADATSTRSLLTGSLRPDPSTMTN